MISGVPVDVMREKAGEHAPVLLALDSGAALLALEATGKIKSIADVEAPLEQAYEPDMARHARYSDGLERRQRNL